MLESLVYLYGMPVTAGPRKIVHISKNRVAERVTSVAERVWVRDVAAGFGWEGLKTGQNGS